MDNREKALEVEEEPRESITQLLGSAIFSEIYPLSHQIVSEISQLIETLKLRPGEIISENEIAKALSISKTPVREALIRLEELGFVNIVPKVGSYVTPINISRFYESCFIRIQLEAGAVQRAATRLSKTEKEALFHPVIEKQIVALETEAREDFYNLDQALHHMFFDVAEVPGVWKTINRSQTDVNRIRHLKRLFKISRAAQVVVEHKVIVKAICDGQPEAAREALIIHIGSLDKEINTLSSHPDLLKYIDTLNSAPTRRHHRQAKAQNDNALLGTEK